MFIVSYVQRHDNLDVDGDPWDGRSLEWSTPSPAPVYSFARLPHVIERDAFWVAKRNKLKDKGGYEDVILPKNTPLGLLIGIAALSSGFGIVWQPYRKRQKHYSNNSPDH